MTKARDDKTLVFAVLAGALGFALDASPVAAADTVVMGAQAMTVQPIQPTQPTQPVSPAPVAQPTPPVGANPIDSFNPIANQPHMAKEKPKTKTYLSISLTNVLVTSVSGPGDGKPKDNDTKDQEPQPGNTPPPQDTKTLVLPGANDLMDLSRVSD